MKIPSILEQYPNIIEACHRYANNQTSATQRPLSIAVCGLYNAGKSSLLNTLAGEFEVGSEAFEIGSARVTTKISKKQFGNLIYIDTPGIDGAVEDDETAWSGLLSADYFLYVHSMRSAEFERQESEFLQTLQERIQGLDKRLALVMTQIDTLKDSSEVDANRRSILEAFELASGFSPSHTFSVSCVRFIKGTAEKKQKLIDLSGIEKLTEWISDIGSPKNRVDAHRFRRASLETERQALIDLILPITQSWHQKYLCALLDYEDQTKKLDKAAANLVLKVRRTLERLEKY